MKVIDATNLKVGRLASYVAKDALKGEVIRIVNAEKAVITGTKDSIFKRYEFIRDVGSRYHGPYYPRRADRILKRAIRGMLPYTKKTGWDAFTRVKTYIGVPEEFSKEKFQTVEGAKLGVVEKRLYTNLDVLSKHLGSANNQ